MDGRLFSNPINNNIIIINYPTKCLVIVDDVWRRED